MPDANPLLIPVGEWLPDQPDYGNPGSSNVENVIPETASSYGPMPSLVTYSGALQAEARGAYSFKDQAGTTHLFAGDKSRLYKLETGTSWGDVSASDGYAVPSADPTFERWTMVAYGERIVAVNGFDPVQTFLVGTDAAFSNLGGGCPGARFCATVRDFLVLAHTFEGATYYPRRLRWSAIGDPTTWPAIGSDAAATVESDQQDLEQSDLGQIVGIVGQLGAADGVIFCEHGLWQMMYAGPPNIFEFHVIVGAKGCSAPGSIVVLPIAIAGVQRLAAAYLGEDGWYVCDGVTVLPIGAEKVDRFFVGDGVMQGDINSAGFGTVQGTLDPIRKCAYWAYSSNGALGGAYDRVAVWNWSINRWSIVTLSIEWLMRSLTVGLSLDSLDDFGTLDELGYALDSPVWAGGRSVLAAFTTDHKLAYATGAALAATVDTTERQLLPGRRARIKSVRPIVENADDVMVAIALRDRTADAIAFGDAVALNAIGLCPTPGNARQAGRYMRARLTVPAGSSFTHLIGIEPDIAPAGNR